MESSSVKWRLCINKLDYPSRSYRALIFKLAIHFRASVALFLLASTGTSKGGHWKHFHVHVDIIKTYFPLTLGRMA